MGINWNTSDHEAAVISDIVDRASALYARTNVRIDRLELEMDLSACHLNGCPLRLEDLLNASDFAFTHDIRGISRHIDRRTGELRNHFLPRYAEPQSGTAEDEGDAIPMELRA